MTSSWDIQCSTPGCDAAPLKIKPHHALAIIEHLLIRDPDAKFRLPCSRCGRTTSYTRDAILQMIPPSQRARQLSPGRTWAFLLGRIETEFDQNMFAGERLLVEVAATKPTGEWEGRLVTTSHLLPEFVDGTYVRGETARAFRVIASVLAGDQTLSFTPTELHGQFNFALFMSPKSEDPLDLTCANVFCANASCSTVFSLTFSGYQSEYEKAQDHAANADAGNGATPYVFLECKRCGVVRVVDENTFADLAHL